MSNWQKFAAGRHAASNTDDFATTNDPQIWRDPDLLWRWTIRMLVETDSYDPLPKYLAGLAEQQRRALVHMARHDPEAFAAGISRHPNLIRIIRKRPAGRPKGPKHGLADAWRDVKHIRRAWQFAFKHCYRKAYPTAIDIAAGFHGFTSRQLINYGKNHRKAKKG
jgi:hypothetical protein